MRMGVRPDNLVERILKGPASGSDAAAGFVQHGQRPRCWLRRGSGSSTHCRSGR
jgi:hypothetical protein